MKETQEAEAFEFDGTWREYAPIAFTNLLLIIVTLGIYRFWATARSRRYLWSRTRFIDDRLEWSGTGLELFKGALTALIVIFVPIALINMLAQRLIIGGNMALGSSLSGLIIFVVFYLVGVARFRAVRYRLSHTYWRGIRGGSPDPGLIYGWSSMWKNALGTIALGLLIPWSMVSLWNERMNKMSFGPYPFEASGKVEGLMGRFLMFYVIPILGIVGGAMFFASAVGLGTLTEGPTPSGAAIFGVFVMIMAFYFSIGLVFMAYYAKFYRQMVSETRLHTLEFGFQASTKDWIKLYLGDIGLAIITLGIGSIFIGYRHWKFMVTHMKAYGEINVDELSQSDLPELHQGEGLLDAFDIGAF